MPATASRTVPFHAFANTPHDVAVPSAIHASRICRSDTPTPVIDPYRSHTNDRTRPNRRTCPTNSPHFPTLRSREYAIRVTFTLLHPLPPHHEQHHSDLINKTATSHSSSFKHSFAADTNRPAIAGTGVFPPARARRRAACPRSRRTAGSPWRRRGTDHRRSARCRRNPGYGPGNA